MRNWAAKYIGKPYKDGGRGPNEFDCWGLPFFALREDFMTEVPTFPIHPSQIGKITEKITSEEKSPFWVKLAVPEEGCLLGLSHHTKFHHVAMFTFQDEGLVIHALPGSGVVADTLAQLRGYGWNRIEFFAPASWHA